MIAGVSLRDGIPVLLETEARPLALEESHEFRGHYSCAFRLHAPAGKPLQDINGKPMIVHVLERARESGADRIIVATDHEDVARAVEAAGGEVCMTRADHQSGTERLAEVVEKCAFSDDTIIVNIQGDEPMIPWRLSAVAENLAASSSGMATLAVPIHDAEEAFNPNAVKVVMDAKGYALYFSRATIPRSRSLCPIPRDHR